MFLLWAAFICRELLSQEADGALGGLMCSTVCYCWPLLSSEVQQPGHPKLRTSGSKHCRLCVLQHPFAALPAQQTMLPYTLCVSKV